ncbi:MAG: ABC transporter permease [Rickettsiaceae bacterium]|nr:ABC transporter permease [Rickettsiaceae bacterium]
MIKNLFSFKYWDGIILLVKVAIARRNANTILGGLWGLIQPFLHIAVISFFMSFLLRFEPKTLVTNLVGALPFWTFMAQGIGSASESLKHNAQVLKRVLLPKTYFPISDIIGNCYTLLYSFSAMYVALILFFPELFSWNVLFIPFLSIPLIISVMSSGILAAYLTPYVRDIPQFLNVIFGVLYWTVPIIYPYSMVTESKQIFYELHPIYIVLKPMQDLIRTGNLPELMIVAKSWLVCILVSLISYFFYRKLARNIIYYL